MNTWKVILATLVIFGAGVITGGLLVSHSDQALHHSTRSELASGNRPNVEGMPATDATRKEHLPPRLPGPMKKEFLSRLDKELKLSPGQRRCIEKIISEGQEHAGKIWSKVEPEMHRALAETRSRICAQLNPEQKARFDELLKKHPRKSQHPASPADISTNALPDSATNSAAISKDSLYCMLFQLTSGYSTSNCATATRCQ